MDRTASQSPLDESKWDKTFEKSDKVDHHKVRYTTKFGIEVAADLYLPMNMDQSKRHAALIVGAPYGGVKEQGAGIYAQTMAERGYVALAFDESYNGESGGEPRQLSSPELFVEDFSAAVDFIGTRTFVDREKIGVIGICGSGGFSISAAQVDKRIKAVATVSMYDMSRVKANGWMDSMTSKERSDYLTELGEQRWREFEGHEVQTLGLPEILDENADAITREFYEYYKMPRGQHPRSSSHFKKVSDMGWMNFPLMNYIKSISPRPLLFVIGENAHSRYFSEDAYKMAAQPKELYVVPNAGHVDLYDKINLIPFDKLESFFEKSLSQ